MKQTLIMGAVAALALVGCHRGGMGRHSESQRGAATSDSYRSGTYDQNSSTNSNNLSTPESQTTPGQNNTTPSNNGAPGTSGNNSGQKDN